MTENEFKDRIIESSLSANARLVCYVLLQYRNRKTGECYPSQNTISSGCNLCRNTVSRAVKELEEKGYVEISKKRLKGQKFTSLYYCFNIEKSGSCAAGEQSNDVSNDVSIDVSNDVAADAHKPNKPNKPNNNKKKTKVLAIKPDGVNKELWDQFLYIRKEKKSPLTKIAFKGIEREANKANWKIEDAINECVERGWAGFKADWVEKKNFKKGNDVNEMDKYYV